MRAKPIIATISVALLIGLVGCGSSGSEGGSGTTEPPADADFGTTADTGGDANADDTPTDPGEDVELPEGWPDELALPDDTTLTIAHSVGDGDQMMAKATINGPAEAAFKTLEDQLKDADYEIVGSTFTPSDQGGYGSISAQNGDYTVAIAFGPDPTGDTSEVQISISKV